MGNEEFRTAYDARQKFIELLIKHEEAYTEIPRNIVGDRIDEVWDIFELTSCFYPNKRIALKEMKEKCNFLLGTITGQSNEGIVSKSDKDMRQDIVNAGKLCEDMFEMIQDELNNCGFLVPYKEKPMRPEDAILEVGD